FSTSADGRDCFNCISGGNQLITAPTTTYALSGLTGGSTYHCRVRAGRFITVSEWTTAWSSTGSFSTTSNDLIGPSLSINSHSNGQTVSSSTINLFGTASDSGRGDNGISSVTVNGIGASGGTATGSGTANWSIALPLNQGANNITVVARDNSASQNS